MLDQQPLDCLDSESFRQAVIQAGDSIVIIDAKATDQPIVYCNPSFEILTGYAPADVIGRNCRFLQADDRHQQAGQMIDEAMLAGRACVAVLRNYRADGSLFWNELSISPLRQDDGEVSHFLGIQRDVSHYVQAYLDTPTPHAGLRRSLDELSELALSDPLTGLRNRRQFDTILEREWRICRREQQPVSLAWIDVDRFKSYNDCYGHVAGDQCLKQIADTFGILFKRGGDLVARLGGDEIVVLAPRQEPEKLAQRLEDTCRAVAALAILHAGTPTGVVSISVGVAGCIPTADSRDALTHAADQAMYQAKRHYPGSVSVAAAL